MDATTPPGTLWALKELHPHVRRNPTELALLRVEAYRTALFSHPHLVSPRAFDPAGGALGLAYVDGVSLAYLLDAGRRAGGSLDPAVVVRVLLDVLSALEAVHAERDDGTRLVHGDVNPRNVLVDRSGHAWLGDFGAAAPANMVTPFRGTLAYAAPEVLRNAAGGPASDLFSVAVMGWEALRGERLFRRRTASETMVAVVEQPAPPVDQRRPALRALREGFEEALRPDLAHRPATAATWAQHLAAAIAPAARGIVGELVAHRAAAEFTRRDQALADVRQHLGCSSR